MKSVFTQEKSGLHVVHVYKNQHHNVRTCASTGRPEEAELCTGAGCEAVAEVVCTAGAADAPREGRSRGTGGGLLGPPGPMSCVPRQSMASRACQA